jgi:hypothetical protein
VGEHRTSEHPLGGVFGDVRYVRSPYTGEHWRTYVRGCSLMFAKGGRKKGTGREPAGQNAPLNAPQIFHGFCPCDRG